MIVVGVPQETFPEERRVALVPAVLPSLTKAGIEIVVEGGAGIAAGFSDEEYTGKGARIATSRAQLFSDAHIIAQVRACGANLDAGRMDIGALRSGQALIGLCHPFSAADTAREPPTPAPPALRPRSFPARSAGPSSRRNWS